jgi:hypothetical protein
MTLFIEKTWPLWWMLAVIIILRWFHVTSADIDAEIEKLPTRTCEHDTRGVRNELRSRA